MEPKWSKGYCRRAAALAGQGSIDQAIAAYQAALPLDPDKATIQSRIDSLGQAKAKVKGEGSNRTSDKGEAQREKSTPPHLKFDDESKNMHLQRESRGYSSQGKGVPENVTLTSPTSRNGGLPMSSSSSQKSPSDEQVKGNKAFEVGDFKAAIEHYSNAILFDPLNHILFRRSKTATSACVYSQAGPRDTVVRASRKKATGRAGALSERAGMKAMAICVLRRPRTRKAWSSIPRMLFCRSRYSASA
eukprot:749666-Hanusia_phi.AAC.4